FRGAGQLPRSGTDVPGRERPRARGRCAVRRHRPAGIARGPLRTRARGAAFRYELPVGGAHPAVEAAVRRARVTGKRRHPAGRAHRHRAGPAAQPGDRHPRGPGRDDRPGRAAPRGRRGADGRARAVAGRDAAVGSSPGGLSRTDPSRRPLSTGPRPDQSLSVLASRADADRLVMHPIRTPRIGLRAPGGIMLTSSTIEGTNIVTATYDGSLSAEDMDAVRTDLQAKKAAHGSVRLLMEYGDIGRIEPEALWKDLKTAGMLGDIERCALVTDSNWIEKLGAAAGRVTSVEMLTFSTDQRDEALAWLS